MLTLVLAEEIQNAPYVIPLSMGVSTMLNGTLGFAMMIALMFCMPSDISGTLEAVTLYPFMSIYTYAVGSTAGATAMVSLSIGHLHLYQNLRAANRRDSQSS